MISQILDLVIPVATGVAMVVLLAGAVFVALFAVLLFIARR